MTPERIQLKLGEQLQKQLTNKFELDLSLNGRMCEFDHPLVIKARLAHEMSQEQCLAPLRIQNWSFESFENMLEARLHHPNISNEFLGKPWAIKNFFSSSAKEALIDFQHLGSIFLTQNKLNSTPHNQLLHLTLGQWLNYIFSEELWNENGKWSRFHNQLMNLFTQKNLLLNTSQLGYYPLRIEASKLESFGFKGSRIENGYLLVLPWTFSLSALKQLEMVILQEF